MLTWNRLGWVCLFSFLTTILSSIPQASKPTQPVSSEEVVSAVSPSVVLILVGQNGSTASGLGSGLVVELQGIIRTAYHIVRDAKQVQIRLKNGEVLDNLELLGVDSRRDVAPLGLTAHALPTLGQGKALGIIVGSGEGQNLNFAVPIESVLGVANVTPSKAFASGSELRLPETPKPRNPPRLLRSLHPGKRTKWRRFPLQQRKSSFKIHQRS